MSVTRIELIHLFCARIWIRLEILFLMAQGWRNWIVAVIFNIPMYERACTLGKRKQKRLKYISIRLTLRPYRGLKKNEELYAHNKETSWMRKRTENPPPMIEVLFKNRKNYELLNRILIRILQCQVPDQETLSVFRGKYLKHGILLVRLRKTILKRGTTTLTKELIKRGVLHFSELNLSHLHNQHLPYNPPLNGTACALK